MIRPFRLPLKLFTALSLLAFAPIAVLWITHRAPGSTGTLGVGRGRFVIDASIDPANCSISLARYDQPLVHYHADAALIRTRRYGWFAGQIRQSGREGAGFRYVRTEIEYGNRPALFQTSWGIGCPNLFALSVTALAPLLAFRRHLRRNNRRQIKPQTDE